MQRIRLFAGNIAGSSIEKFSVAAGLIALSAIAATHVLATWTKNGHGGILASLQAPPPPPSTITAARVIRPGAEEPDYFATGAISRPIVLEPCTGKTKP
jgi:hypothetical protein